MSSELLTVAGTLSFRERIALPPRALATVKLVSADGEVLAGAAVEAAGVPVDFALTADPSLVGDSSVLFLWAALRSEVGVWGTTELVSVTGEDTAVTLTRIDD